MVGPRRREIAVRRCTHRQRRSRLREVELQEPLVEIGPVTGTAIPDQRDPADSLTVSHDHGEVLAVVGPSWSREDHGSRGRSTVGAKQVGRRVNLGGLSTRTPRSALTTAGPDPAIG